MHVKLLFVFVAVCSLANMTTTGEPRREAERNQQGQLQLQCYYQRGTQPFDAIMHGHVRAAVSVVPDVSVVRFAVQIWITRPFQVK